MSDCCQRAVVQNKRRGSWKALPMALLVAVAPKCPMCLAAWLGAFGLAGLGNLAAHVNVPLLWALCSVGLLATIAWFTLRSGWLGGAAAGLCAAMVITSRLVAGGEALGLAGVLVLALYAGGARLFRAAATEKRQS